MPHLTVEDWKLLNAVAGDEERFRHHAQLEAWFWGHQYDDRAHGWTEEDYPAGHAHSGEPIPMARKRPKVKYPLARRAVQETVDLLVGVQRFPALSATVDGERDDAGSEALGTLRRKSRLPAKVRQACRQMLTCGSSAVGVRPGPGRRSVQLDAFPGRYCTPVFGDDDPAAAEAHDLDADDLVHLRVQYAFARDERVGTETKRRWFAWRRDYTPVAVIDYDTPEIRQDAHGAWTSIPEFRELSRWEHGLGFVPAEWFRTEELEHTPDGWSLYELVLEVMEDFDYRWSQVSDALQYNLDPLLGLLGFDPMDTGGVIKRGKGNTLSLPRSVGGETPDAKYIEMSGQALELAMKHLQELRTIALEAMRVVIQRHEDAAGAQSGVSLDKLYRPMISLIEGLRVEVGDAVRRLASKMLACADELRGDLRYELPAFDVAALDVEVDWPPVFTPTPEELAQEAQAYAGLVGAGVLSQETATERVAARLDIDDADREKERIAAEREERAGEVVPAVPAAGDPGAAG
jgi:hypothetical protein